MRKWKEALSFHKTGWGLIKVAHSIDSTFLPLQLLNVICKVIPVYGKLILTANLIDALLGQQFRNAFLFAGSVLLVDCVFGCISNLLEKYRFKSYGKMSNRMGEMVRMKAISMDYETMEKSELADKIQFMERTMRMFGGLYNAMMSYCAILQNVITIVTSMVMVLALCLTRPVSDGVLGVVAKPWVSVLLFLLVLLGMIMISIKASEFCTRQEDAARVGHTGNEMKLTYFIQKVMQDYKAGKVIRLYHMKPMILKNELKFVDKQEAFYGRMCDTFTVTTDILGGINAGYTFLAYLLVAVKTLTGAITIGSFTQYAGALAQFGNACYEIVYNNYDLRRICTNLEFFLEFMETKSNHATGSIPVEKRNDGEYELAFEDVSFHYPGNEEMVLSHINCKLKLKGKMAVVGRNGAGKTTFIKLLCRLYEPTEGRITLNGVDIRKYDEEEYRELFGVVFQDFKLFSFPVWKNIVAGFPREDARLKKCLEQAGAAEFVEKLPQQEDTILYKNKKEGVDISGGEAQKLALARALYKDAPIVILDEPTAALDPFAEAEVYAGFDDMVKEKTSIYISHRMSSCRFCEDIIVFDQGQIVERGSHEALLVRDGQYAKLWKAQAKYYVGA